MVQIVARCAKSDASTGGSTLGTEFRPLLMIKMMLSTSVSIADATVAHSGYPALDVRTLESVLGSVSAHCP